MLKLITSYRLSIILGLVFVFSVFLVGCSSKYTTIAPNPPNEYEKLGHASGKATGSLGILATAYYFIPMGLNSRIDRAYDNALKSVPGATALTNVTFEESWFWWVIGTGRTVTVSGEAIKEVTP